MIPILKAMTKGGTGRGKKNNFILPVAMLGMLILVGQAYWLTDNRQLFAPFAISRIPCDYCAKMGVVRDGDDVRITRMCQACFGVGYKTIRGFDELDVVCAACGGLGRLKEQEEWRTCQRCDGRGIHRADDWERVVQSEPAPASDELSGEGAAGNDKDESNGQEP